MSDTCYPFKRIVHYSVWMTNGNCVPRSWSMLQWLLGALNVTGLCMLASKTGPSQCEPVIIFFPLEILIATKTTYMPIDIIVGRKINWAHIVGVANYSRIKIKYNIWSLPYSIQKPIFSSGPLKNHLCKNVAVKSKKKKNRKRKKSEWKMPLAATVIFAGCFTNMLCKRLLGCRARIQQWERWRALLAFATAHMFFFSVFFALGRLL